jgi:O-antigen ligase
VLGLTSVFAIALLTGILSSSESRRERTVGIGSFIVLLGGVSNSGSRAAVLAGVVAIAVLVVLTRQRKVFRYAAIAVAGGLMAIGVGLYKVPESSALNRLVRPSLVGEADNQRGEAIDDTIERISDHYLTGSGFAAVGAAHNLPLQVVDSAGPLGAVAFAALVASILRVLVCRRHDPFVAGVLAMYVSYLAAGLVQPPLWDRWVWFPIACGLAAATWPAQISTPTFQRSRLDSK